MNERTEMEKVVFRKPNWRAHLAAFVSLVLFVVQSGACVCPAYGAATDSLSPGAREVAERLGILSKVERLIELKQQSGGQSSGLSDEELGLKVDVLDKVMGASLEVRMVSGRIDRELIWAFAGQGMLESRRQRNLNFLTTANFMQGGILGLLSGPAILSGYPTAGTELLLLGSSIGLALSTVSLIASRSGTKKIDGGTNILADVFHLNHPEAEHHPELVIKYLNSVPPQSTNNQTRIQTLIQQWEKEKYLKVKTEEQLAKLAILDSVQNQKENISLISKRIRMLYDTQYTVQALDADLLDLLRVTN